MLICRFLWFYVNSQSKLFPAVLGQIGHTEIPGVWTQELDVELWTLDSGRWTLDAGLWTLDSERWTLGAGLWTLDSGRWTLVSGRWTLDAGLWTLDSECWTLNPGRWTLDAGPWTLNSGHWMLGSGCWTLDSWCWTLGSGHWTLSMTVLEQDQQPVSDSALFNYWKFCRCESLRTSWSHLLYRGYRFWLGYF